MTADDWKSLLFFFFIIVLPILQRISEAAAKRRKARQAEPAAPTARELLGEALGDLAGSAVAGAGDLDVTMIGEFQTDDNAFNLWVAAGARNVPVAGVAPIVDAATLAVVRDACGSTNADDTLTVLDDPNCVPASPIIKKTADDEGAN